MRLVLTLLALSGTVGSAMSADTPGPKESTKQDILKQLEGDWVLKSALVATPQGVSTATVNAPGTPKMSLRIKDGAQYMMTDGKPITNGGSTLELGSEAQCLLWHGRPGQKTFKVRFKIEGVTLTIVQDMRFQEECPESFDPEKGRLRDRRVLIFTWQPHKP